MRYNTTGVEPLQISDVYLAAISAAVLIDQAMSQLGPGTRAWRLLVPAREEAENWAAYLALGGHEALGKYKPCRPKMRS